MAAFDNSPPQGFSTSPGFPRLYDGRAYIIVTEARTGYYDNFRYSSYGLEALVKDFAHAVAKIQARDAFAHRARERTTGRDFKTAAGTRPYWYRPEAPVEAPPAGLSFPRWREFARRRA